MTLFDHRATLSGDQGFASIDALTALTLLALTIAVCLQCVHVAGRLNANSEEIGRAERLTRSIMDATDVEPGDLTGEVRGFQWRYHSEFAAPTGPTEQHLLCARTTTLRSDAGKTYSLSTLSLCGGRPT